MDKVPSLDRYRRGFHNLATALGIEHRRIIDVRMLQRKLIEAITTASGNSPVEAAVIADILDSLNRLSFELVGRSFDTFCGLPAIPPPQSQRIVEIKQPDTFESYVTWLTALWLLDRFQEPEILHRIQNATLALLGKLDGNQKGRLVQFLYDNGWISSVAPLVSLARADLSRANLVEAMLSGADLSQVNLTASHMVGATLTKVVFTGANLVGINLGWAVLTDADLSQTELGGATLMGAELRRANLHGANLVKANLRRASLENTDLSQANLLNADLETAILTVANLEGTNLLWCNFKAARLDGANLHRAVYNRHTHWPEDFDPVAQGAAQID